MNGRKDHSPHWHWLVRGIIVNCKSEILYQQSNKEVIVETGSRSGADAATATGSGDRQQHIPDWLEPFTEGLEWKKDNLDYPAVLVSNSQNTSSTYSSETLEQIWIVTQFIYSFSEGPQLRLVQTRKKHESSMQEESSKSRRQDTRSNNIWTYNYSGSPSSQWRERTSSIASSICGSGTGFGQPMDTD